MDYIYLKARAKINVALDVLGKRDDGYHEMRMVMQSLRLSDTVFIKRIEKNSLKLSCNLKWLPLNEKNIAYAAARLMMDEYHLPGGVFIELNKEIPVAAGLAGGSSDCAAVLYGLRKIFDLPITDAGLMTIGARLGADVPYCLMRGTALAEGIGDRLSALPPHPLVYVLLAKPPVSVSTAAVFSQLDVSEIRQRPDIDKMKADLKKGDIKAIADGMVNVLEPVTASQHEIIYRLKAIMLENSALGAVMSGSGPTVFGYFVNRADAQNAINSIRRSEPAVKEIYLTQTYNPQRKGAIRKHGSKSKSR